jgi:putative peptidoglycan lipid II flippase
MSVALPLTRVLFEHGEFTLADSERTAALIRAYGAGVWAFCGMPILYRGFYAVGDRLSPVRVGMCAVFFDALLNLTLIWPLAERGLAWSTAFSAAVQFGTLAWLLQGHVGQLDWRKLAVTMARTLAATAAMAAGCLTAIRFFPFDDNPLQQMLSLIVPVGTGIVVYLAAARLVKLDEPGWLLARSLPDDEGTEIPTHR